MNPSLTLGQRYAADTPTPFKIIGHIGLVMILSALGMAFGHLPAAVITAVGSLGTGLATITPFIVKDVATVAAAGSPALGVVELLPQLLDQFGQVKSAITDLGSQPIALAPDALSAISGLHDHLVSATGSIQAAAESTLAASAVAAVQTAGVPKMELPIQNPNPAPGQDNVIQMPGAGSQPTDNGLPG